MEKIETTFARIRGEEVKTVDSLPADNPASMKMRQHRIERTEPVLDQPSSEADVSNSGPEVAKAIQIASAFSQRRLRARIAHCRITVPRRDIQMRLAVRPELPSSA